MSYDYGDMRKKDKVTGGGIVQGRTAGFDLANHGSSPCSATKISQAFKLPTLFYETLLESRKTWKCKYCSSKTTILSEICDNCGREDLNQGINKGGE